MTAPGDLDTRRLGRRGPEVTRVGLGCAPLGNLFTAVTDDDATATVDAAWEAGVRFFDTAPLYGSGLSERRLGAALSTRPRHEFVVSTKVGRVLEPVGGAVTASLFVDTPPLEPIFDFSRDGTLRSLEASLERLRLDRVDVVHVHDPDDHPDEAIAGAFPALVQLRDEGVIGAVGCGMNQVALLRRFVREVDLDCILLAGRYTVLDRSGADALLPECADRGIGVILGGVFNSGLLADPDASATYDYQAAPAHLLAEARRIRDVAASFDVTLPSVAVQFALRHPAVSAVVLGARSPDEIQVDVDAALRYVPAPLWQALGDDAPT